MQWSALENFKLADLHSLTISVQSNSADWQEVEDREGNMLLGALVQAEQ